jgi:protein-S-isoprenylcysteine O-methyltransferase Ste14
MDKKPRILPLVWLLIFLLLQTGLYFYLPLRQLFDGTLRLAGLLPLLSGLWVMISGARAFTRADTPLIPFETSTTLVVSGPFKFTRNPMYLGMTLILTGTGVMSGTLAPLISVILFFIIIRHQYVLPEEKMMKELFGEEFLMYCTRVRRWL